MSNTRGMNETACYNFLTALHNLNGWHKNDRVYPQTIWRNILKQVIIFLRCICDGEYTNKWNKYYHRTSVNENEVGTVTDDTDIEFCNEFNLSHGQKYWLQTKEIMLESTGDSFKFENTPEEVTSGTACLIKVHSLDSDHLHQTLLICVPFIYSGLSHYNHLIAELYHQLVSELGMRGAFSFHIASSDVMMCVRYYVNHNGDWKFKTTVILRCLGNNSKHPFISWIHYKGTSFRAVSSDGDEWLKAVEAGIKPEHMPWRLDESAIDPKSDFYTLCKKSHWDEWADAMENYISKITSKIKNLTEEQLHKKRVNYAKKIGSSVLYKTQLCLLRYILDVMHLILRHAITTQGAITIVCHCALKLSLNQTVSVIAHSC